MQPRHLAPDRLDHRRVVVAGERRVDPALEADLGRAALPRLARAPHDLLERDEVRRPAQVRGEPALREGTEAAAEVADVRVLDVPRHDVADLVAAHLAAQPVGGGEDALPLLAAGGEEPHQLVLAQLVARVHGQRSAGDHERDGAALPRVPPILARQAERIGRAQRRREHVRVEPLGVEEGRIHRQPRRELEPARPRRLREPLPLRPRRLGIDVVDRDRRDAAPVVDPGVEQPREVVVGEVRWRLHGDVVGKQEPRRRDRPEVLVEGRLGMPGHPRPRLGAEVLHDHLLQVAVPLVQVGEREQRVDTLCAGLADPDQDPAREGNAQLTGDRDRLEPGRRELVRRGPVWAAARGQPLGRRLEHDPHRGRDGAQQLELGPGHHPGVQMR